MDEGVCVWGGGLPYTTAFTQYCLGAKTAHPPPPRRQAEFPLSLEDG